MSINDLLAWARGGGGAIPHRLHRAGCVWRVKNTTLSIPSRRTTEHPVIILSMDPLLVIVGSDSHVYNVGDVVETFDNQDLGEKCGPGFAAPTSFEVCREVPIASSEELFAPIGVLSQVAWQRVLEARKHCW